MAVGRVTTAKGVTAEVHTRGSGHPLLWLHSAGGLYPSEPLLDLLAERYLVYAPVWPGFGEDATEGALEDMLDFALHGWDLVEALGLGGARPHLVGHSMGGMVAAEMACLNPRGIDRLVLVAAAGLWIDELPVPDIFAMLPFELAEALFADPAAGERLLMAGTDFGDDEAMKRFLVGNARRLGTAGKILFPIPNRRRAKRLYRMDRPALALWGREDRLFPPRYGERFVELLPDARLTVVPDAGHMLPYEQPESAAAAIVEFLDRP
jgi:pimeloyl-ACP methyl ester carboxylesterase